MNDSKIGFYEEVEIVSDMCAGKYLGKKGAVLGISEENGVIFGYSILLQSADQTLYFDKAEVIATGVKFSRSDFY